MTELTWHEWGIDAFQAASDAGKLILLDITAFWCHYCHVMENTTYKDPNIIELLNKNCVCIRIDVDKHPDLVERYNLGGYPTTAFLTATGLLIGGGTYFPPKEFLDMATKVINTIEEKQTIPVSSVWKKRLDFEQKVQPGTKLDQEMLRNHAQFILPHLDAQQGGVGPQKFPFPDLVRFLWAAKTPESLKLAQLTLNNQLKLLDPKGGFFRFAQNPDWTNPSQEKTLEANAQLAMLYQEAYERTNNEEYKKASESATNYILTLQQKGFFAGNSAEGNTESVTYTDKNAQAITALFTVGKTSEAKQALDYILKTQLNDTELKHARNETKGLLQDYAYLIQALLEATEQTKTAKYLEVADKLMKFCLESLHTTKGAFYDRLKQNTDIGYLQDQLIPLEPNVIMAQNLDQLAKIKQDPKYATYAKKTLLKFQNHYKAYGALASNYVLTVHNLLQ